MQKVQKLIMPCAMCFSSAQEQWIVKHVSHNPFVSCRFPHLLGFSLRRARRFQTPPPGELHLGLEGGHVPQVAPGPYNPCYLIALLQQGFCHMAA